MPFAHQPSPLSATQAPLEASLFDTSVESPFEHPHARLASTPPADDYLNNASPRDVDRIFDEFVTHPEDDNVNPNEVAEALEDRGRENEAETAANEEV